MSFCSLLLSTTHKQQQKASPKEILSYRLLRPGLYLEETCDGDVNQPRH